MPASRQKEYDAFISYRREHGAELARLIKAQLRQRGLAVFLDVDDLPVGHFDEAILRHVQVIPNFILILSPGCLRGCLHKGDWLRRGICCALEKKRNVVPIRMPGFTFPNPAAFPADIKAIRLHQCVGYSHEFSSSDYRVEIVRKKQRDIGYVPKSAVILLDPATWFRVRNGALEGWILSRYIREC